MKWLSLLPVAIASLTSAQPRSSPTVTQTPHASSNASIGIQEFVWCSLPVSGVGAWYYNGRNDGPHDCYGTNYYDMGKWAMLNAYRGGGTEGVHWKYTDNVNDPDCLVNWEYYSADGTTLYAKINGRTTTERDPRRWCALPVYRSGGVENKQWKICNCVSWE